LSPRESVNRNFTRAEAFLEALVEVHLENLRHLRWLKETRHQISDIAPDAECPVHARVQLGSNSVTLTFVTTRIEMPRIRDQLPEIFEGLRDVKLQFQESLSPLLDAALAPGSPGYDDVLTEVVRPLWGGENGNQMRKLEWLYAMAGGAH
jgi:hypothetical protein